jgi:hypothetical protein
MLIRSALAIPAKILVAVSLQLRQVDEKRGEIRSDLMLITPRVIEHALRWSTHVE